MKYPSLSRPGPRGELPLNLTAMIDVVFLLIVFFMLICQFIRQEYVPIQVPQRVEALQPEQSQDQVTVSIYADPQSGNPQVAVRGRHFPYSGDEIWAVAVTAEIQQEQAKHRDQPVRLRAEESLAYGDIRPVLEALGQAGVTQLQLSVQGDRHNE